MFKGLLALIVCGVDLHEESGICHIWVMKKYGVVDSWTKRSLRVDYFVESFGCTVNGELLIQRIFPFRIVSFDPESLKEEILEIPSLGNLTYIANFNDSLVLLDGVNVSS